MAFKQEVNVPLLFTIGIISGIMILVIVIGVQAWYQSEEMNEVAYQAQQATDRAYDPASPTKTFAELKKEQQDALNAEPHWTDPAKKAKATMKINDAVAYVIDHQGKMP